MLCQHFYPELVSTGLHMTELTTKLHALYPNYDITVFCSYPSKKDFQNKSISKEELYKGVNIIRSSNIGKEHGNIIQRLIFGLFYFFNALLYTFKNRRNFDLIISTTNPPFIGLIPSIIKKIPFLLIVHDIYPDTPIRLGLLSKNSPIVWVWKKINNKIYKSVNRAIVIGTDMEQIIKQKLHKRDHYKITLIHNWSDSEQIHAIPENENLFLKNHPQLKNKKILLYSGNMGRTHNIEVILQAAQDLGYRDDVAFVFIGGGHKRKIVENHIHNCTVQNVTLLPYQPFEMLGHVLSSATLSFVCLDKEFSGLSVPSKSYGIMASKTPLIGILDNQSEIAQTILKYNCGIVHNVDTSIKLSDSIESLLSNPTILSQYSENSLEAFLTNYDLKVIVVKYEKAISQTLKI